MKIVKLLLLAIVLVGGIVALLWLKPEPKKGVEGPEVGSPQAKMWKGKIEELCQEGKWTVAGYKGIEGGIHSDRVNSDGELIRITEEQALVKYLFALSSSSLWENADKHFQQSAYSEKKIDGYREALEFLNGKVGEFGANSNLTNVSGLLSGYDRLKKGFGFSGKATYSRPLKAFPSASVSSLENRIKGMKYWKSHYSHNTSLRKRLDNLEKDRKRAEREYYENLERLVEENYQSMPRIEVLLADQIRFNEISTNEEAKEKLDEFVKNTDD